MKKQILGIIAMVIVVCQFNLGTLFAQQVKEIPFKLDEIGPPQLMNGRTMAASPLQLKLKIATQQPVSSKGLQFILVITNGSSAEVSIYNPLDVLRILMQSEIGQFASIMHQSLISSQYRGFFVPKFESFEIGDTFINGKKREVDYHTSENIPIPANGTYQVNLSILNVIKRLSAASVEERETITKIKKGKYKLRFSIITSTVRTAKDSFVYGLKTPEVEVVYGQ